MKHNESSTKNSSWKKTHLFIVILIILQLLISIWAVFIRPDGAVKLEILRAGGKENYQKIVEFYKSDAYISQQTQSINEALQQGAAGNPSAVNNEPSNAVNNIANSSDDIAEAVVQIVEDGYVQGNPDARYTLIEYSDLECPFCQRHHQNGTISAFVEENPGDVNTVFRHFPLSSIHPNAQLAAEGVECVGELKGNEGFYDYIDAVFALPSISQANLVQAADSLGLDTDEFTSCLTSGRYTTRVMEQLQEGQSLFGVTGTPGNVLVDTKTGRYVVIAGAYPLDKFQQELATLQAGE